MTDSRFSKTCSLCGKEFTMSAGEIEFYELKHFVIPNKCKECRQAIKQKRQFVLQDISKNWKLDAKNDAYKYFYTTQYVDSLMCGDKHFVIGRKGSGKTAICKHIVDQNDGCSFSEKLTFKNFPFNTLYACDNSKYTAPNQYITIWKYMIYSCVCRLMVSNENIDTSIRGKLEKLYPDPLVNLPRLVEKWTTTGFGATLFGHGFELNRDKIVADISWIDKVNILEDIIENHLDDSKYYIVIDELDEDYRAFETEEQKTHYIYLLTSLFKAVQDIKSIFSGRKCIYPIVFLRNDIYEIIRDSDKAKWADFRIDIEWDRTSIKRMLANRISAAVDTEYILPFDAAWKRLFDSEIAEDTFERITRSTHLRPRDYVKYIQECATHAIDDKHNFVLIDDVKWADKAFSNYLKEELEDEMFAILPDIREVFAMLSQMRKTIFSQIEFCDAYSEYVQKGIIRVDKGWEYVLNELFNFSIIGNRSQPRGKTFFKYENREARFNYKEDLEIHRGLHKALQLV